MKFKYVECCCHDLDHIVRFIYDDDDNTINTVSIDFKIQKFPIIREKCEHFTIRNIIDKIKFNIDRIKLYFVNIWWAVKGVPNWYTAYAEFDPDQIYDIHEFTGKCLEEFGYKGQKS